MLFLIQKEFKQIIRNKFLPRIIVLFPILVILIIPWVANMEIKNVNLAVLDFDSTPTSKKLIEEISATSYFNVVFNSKTPIILENASISINAILFWNFQMDLKKI